MHSLVDLIGSILWFKLLSTLALENPMVLIIEQPFCFGPNVLQTAKFFTVEDELIIHDLNLRGS